jgi:uncharacterized membrane protein YagU involved in acid resistance
MSRLSPLGAVCGGVVAGLVGCLAQDLFFALTKKIAPAAPRDVFEPPEPGQFEEFPTQTVARRVVEDFLERGPLLNKARGGRIVHYAFGSSWGSAYGVVASTFASARTLRGGVAFGLAVWLISDDVLLPAFRLAAWPHHYPVKTHAYAIAAHIVYGAAVCGSFALMERAAAPLSTSLGSLWLTRKAPRFLRPTARRVTARALRVALPAREAAIALGVLS